MSNEIKRAPRLSKTTRTNYFTYLGVITAYILMQILTNAGKLPSSLEGQLIPVCAYVVAALSLNLTVGVLGELSLGHAGFMSVGAFTGAVVASVFRNSIASDTLLLIVAIIFGVVFAAIAGVLVGIPVLRLRGDYLAIVTLAFGEIIKYVINTLFIGVDAGGVHISLSQQSLNLGEGGRNILKGASGVGDVKSVATFTAGVILILITLFVIFNLVNSRSGRAVMALRDNRIAAESVGINITKYKMMAFVTSAALAGAAGTMFALSQPSIEPRKFDFNMSIQILVFVVLGGQGRMWGSIIAATALTILPELEFMRSFKEYRMLIYAVILILVMLFTYSKGLSWKRLFTWVLALGAGYGLGEGVRAMLNSTGAAATSERMAALLENSATVTVILCVVALLVLDTLYEKFGIEDKLRFGRKKGANEQ